MKNFLLIALFFIPCAIFGQNDSPDLFKHQKALQNKGDINYYYNPVLDKYDIKFVKLDLAVSDESTYIQGNATITAKVVKLLDTLVLDFHNSMQIDSVFFNSKKIIVLHENHEIKYLPDPAIGIDEEFTMQIFYHGTPDENGGGVTNEYDYQWNKNVTWSLSESFHAYEWWPTKQVLSDKIDSVYVFFTCDNDCMVGSNGILTNVIDLANNKKRFEWKTFYPINYYLISFAVAEYQDYSLFAYPSESDPILIQNFIYNTDECLRYNKSDINLTARFIELYSEKFGLYPFANEKYGHCLTNLGGGMEHQTMTTLGDFNYTLVAHELGHMWFGDYVTCATWQDIWINEGFASYTEYVALENIPYSITAKEWIISAQNSALQSPEGSVYIPFEDAFNESRIFNHSLSYKKGAAIIHMIRHEINNDQLFFTALKNYLNEFGDSVATGEDFKKSIESTTSIDLEDFFDAWYYGKGFPKFDVGYAQINDTLYLTVNESTSSLTTTFFKTTLDYKIYYYGGDTTIRLLQNSNNETFEIPFVKKITNIVVDPDNWVLKAQGTVDSIEHPTNNQNLFKIYPNPVTNYLIINFNIHLKDQLKQMYIYDLNGRLIDKFISNENQYSIPVTNLANGLYFVKVNSSGKTYSYKFIKQ